MAHRQSADSATNDGNYTQLLFGPEASTGADTSVSSSYGGDRSLSFAVDRDFVLHGDDGDDGGNTTGHDADDVLPAQHNGRRSIILHDDHVDMSRHSGSHGGSAVLHSSPLRRSAPADTSAIGGDQFPSFGGGRQQQAVPAPRRAFHSSPVRASSAASTLTAHHRLSSAGRSTMTGAGNGQPRTRGLKEQEKLIADLKKDNFDLKMRVVTLQEHLEEIADDATVKSIRDNTDLRVQLQRLQAEYDELQQQQQQQIYAEEERQQQEQQQQEQEHINHRSQQQLEEAKRELAAQTEQVRQLQVEVGRLRRQSASPAGADALERTVVTYREYMAKLESELTTVKSQLFQSNAQLAQRAVEMERMRGDMEAMAAQAASSTSRHNTASPRGGGGFNPDRSSFTEMMSFDPATVHANSNNQLEQGINMLRDQIGELKMQLIEKQSNAEQLTVELEGKSSAHARTVQQLTEERAREEQRLKRIIEELRSQLSALKSELSRANDMLAESAQSRHADETHLQMEIQSLQQRHTAKNAALISANEKLEQVMSQLRTVEASVAVKSQHIDNLTAQLESKNRLLADMEREHKRSTDRLQLQVHQAETRLSHLDVDNHGKDNEILLLKKQIATQQQQLVAIEERWSKQSRELGAQQQKVRDELDQQIHAFKAETEAQSRRLKAREAELKEARDQLEMHSVGVEAATEQFRLEKERLRQELHGQHTEVERLNTEATKLRGEIAQLQSKYREAISVNERLAFTIKDQDETAATHQSEIAQQLSKLQAKDGELRDVTQRLANLSRKLADTEHSHQEELRAAKASLQKSSSALKERNELLIRLEKELVGAFTAAGIDVPNTEDSDASDPASNFYAFAEKLGQRTGQVGQLFEMFATQLESTERRIDNEIGQWNGKLDKQMDKIASFKSAVMEALKVQRKLQESLHKHRSQLERAKASLAASEHDNAIYKHKIATLESRLKLNAGSEQEKHAELQAKVAELERLVKERDRQCREAETKFTETRDQLHSVQASSQKRVKDLTENIRMLRVDLESSEWQHKQMETLLKSQKQAQALHTNSGTFHLLETAESAIEKMNEKLRADLKDRSDRLDREHQQLQRRNQEYARLRNEYEVLKRRLDKRELIIQMALAKLELVNKRKGSVEQAIQLSSMLRADKSMASIRAADQMSDHEQDKHSTEHQS